MGMVGDLGKYTQYQVASSVPLAAQNEGGLAGVGAGLAAGVGMGQVMMDALRGSQAPAAAPAAATDDPEVRLAKLKALLDKGLVTQADYDSAKAEILKKLIG
jgi:membrane protease subunit (stomatin/prohibitin family)